MSRLPVCLDRQGAVHLCVTSASGGDTETVGEFTFEEPAWIKLWILFKADVFLGSTQAKWNDTFVLFFLGTWLFHVFVNRAILKIAPTFLLPCTRWIWPCNLGSSSSQPRRVYHSWIIFFSHVLTYAFCVGEGRDYLDHMIRESQKRASPFLILLNTISN